MTLDTSKRQVRNLLIAVALFAAAALLRFGLLRHMGLELPYITFYPAVAIAALYGGRLPCLVTTILSSLFVYFWQSTAGADFQQLIQWEGMVIFVATGVIIAQISEALSRARVSGRHAEALARLEKRHAEEAEQARKEVAASEQRFRMLFENSPSGMVVYSLKTKRFVAANVIAQELFGYSEDELRSKGIIDVTYPEDIGESIKYIERLIRGEIAHALIEKRYLTRNGSLFWAQTSVSVLLGADEQADLLVGSILDISERKRMEAALAESEITYRSLFENMLNGFAYCRMLFENGMPSDFIYLDVNAAFEKLTGLRNVVGKHVSEVIPGIRDTDPVVFEIYGRVAQTGNPEKFEVYVSALQMWFSVSVYAPRSEHFVAVFDVISDRKQAEEQIAQYVSQLEASMKGTLQAVSQMVEKRDPYTAGHERRTGIIAADIAREMGWPEEKCMQLQMTGLVNDIGKISVPAEILSKPGKLTDVEYELVKGHARTGYEILRDVNFPWPVAEIIYQHHERMDGSGYPRGLKGVEILPEARILAVADVVEAMLSHRPYRPALGMDAVLSELTSGRVTQYDANVVDAMLRLVRDKGYQLPA